MTRGQDAAAAKARAEHLDRLAGQEPAAWRKVHALIATSQAKRYDEAVDILIDLRDLAARTGDTAGFAARLREFHDRHARKPSLIDRMVKTGLGVSKR